MNDKIEIAKQFAAVEIAPAVNPDFPAIFRKAAAAGLCGIGLPVEYGGSGGGYPEITAFARELTRHGGDAGIAFSLMYHLVVSRFMISGFGSGEQKEALLPDLAAGRKTVCFAVSEPGVGAHPKHIKATAARINGDFVLEGEKSYLSNGPVVDFYILIAITARDGDKKQFTAFLTDRNLPGLTLTPLDVGWLKSSPHCGLRLENCRVPASAILGTQGTAYRDIVMPFRPLEDAVGTGLITGGLERIFAAHLKTLGTPGTAAAENLKEKIGRMYSILTALGAVSRQAAVVLELSGINRELEGLCFWYREMAREFISIAASLPGNGEYDFGRDIMKLVDLGKNVSFLRQAKTGGLLIKEGLK